ncbi:MAG: hypothetical protein KGL92_09975 [Gammaproteobacteria bacterium]|nr:hypothetical protein [Gammaproteobacteria bacterium]
MSALRAVVLALILANVLYFLWAQNIAKPEAPGESAPAPTLQLASEAPQASVAATVAPPAQAATPSVPDGSPGASAAPAPAAAPRCISIGPFLDVAEAARAAATLRGGGYQPRQRAAQGDVWAGVWVYLPLPASPAAAVQMRAKLLAAGIDDALEMPGPHDAPVLSLGLFSEPKRAETRIQLARSAGYNPAVADRKRTGDVYWVDVDLKARDANLNPAELGGESGKILRLQVISCPSA